jgi:hypothetical protein
MEDRVDKVRGLMAGAMRAAAVGMLLGCLWTARCARGAAAESGSVGQGMSAADMATVDQAALGPLAQTVDVTTLGPTHELIENYFAATTRADRDTITQQLVASGVSPEVIGRNRPGWAVMRPGVYYIDEHQQATTVRYFLGVPAGYKRTTSWPLVVKLPEAAAFLTNPWQTGDQVKNVYAQWIADELKAHPDALVLMPLLNLDELYGPGYTGMNLAMQPIFHAAGIVNIDPARVDLIGHSMSAHAVWNLGVHYTTYFAAINPMAGAMDEIWQKIRLPNLSNVLPVVWADSTDKIVNADESRKIVNMLKSNNVPVMYHETSDSGHVPPAALVETMYKEIRAATRPLYPGKVTIQSDRPDTRFNRLDWVQVWDQVNTGKITTMKFTHGLGQMTECQNDYRLDATIDAANHVTVKTDKNVAALRLYFNDQMVDMSKPVTVVVDGKPQFSGMLTADIDKMLKDQLFLGRGWRYFTAALEVDIDFPDAPPMPVTTGSGDKSGDATAPINPTSRPRGHIEFINPDGSEKDYVPGQGAPAKNPPDDLNEQ